MASTRGPGRGRFFDWVIYAPKQQHHNTIVNLQLRPINHNCQSDANNLQLVKLQLKHDSGKLRLRTTIDQPPRQVTYLVTRINT